MKYIDINEIPDAPTGTGRPTTWPYAEWAKMPEGKAVEITVLLNGRHIKAAEGGIRQYVKARSLGLQVIRRGERLWVARPSKPAS